MKDRLRKVQFKYLDYLFENTYGVKSKFYPDSTFFKKDDKVILELEKSGTLWVLYSVWGSISDTFSIQYEETQQLIKEWMEEQLKKGEVTPKWDKPLSFVVVEEELKQDVVVPKKLTLYDSQYMGKQLKKGEVKPVKTKFRVSAWMEEQLKQEVVTPLDAGSNYLPFMEKQLKQEEITPQIRETDIYNRFIESRLELEELTPKDALPPQSWTNLKSEELTQQI